MPSVRDSRRERVHRPVVGGEPVLGAADVVQPGVLRPDARVVQSGGDRVRLDGLAVLVLQQVAARAVQHPGRRRRESWPRAGRSRRRRRRPRCRPGARRVVREEAWKMPMAFEPPPTQAATASGQPAGELEHLRAGLLADDPLEVAHDHRERVRAGDGAER